MDVLCVTSGCDAYTYALEAESGNAANAHSSTENTAPALQMLSTELSAAGPTCGSNLALPDSASWQRTRHLCRVFSRQRADFARIFFVGALRAGGTQQQVHAIANGSAVVRASSMVQLIVSTAARLGADSPPDAAATA